jgi:hypothetical protein
MDHPIGTCSNSLGCDPWASLAKGAKGFEAPRPKGQGRSTELSALSMSKGFPER